MKSGTFYAGVVNMLEAVKEQTNSYLTEQLQASKQTAAAAAAAVVAAATGGGGAKEPVGAVMESRMHVFQFVSLVFVFACRCGASVVVLFRCFLVESVRP